ncbi:MAG: MATE family efflux transporter [Lachnospiraceae bacterium]|nr:MATE family efflux transporter [Lachnospiraceae bacterium]
MNSAEIQYKKMTETPIPKLILGLGLPTTISMLVTNVYNMADTYFVGRLGTSASGATGIVFGLMAILQACGFMYGQGSGTVVSRRLGAGKRDEASEYATMGFVASLVTGILVMVLGLIFVRPLMLLLGSTETIYPYARTYAICILCAAPAMLVSCTYNNILRYEGKATFAMIGLISGGILNIFLDALFIVGLKTGIVGAGIATAVSQYVSVFILAKMYGKCESKISKEFFRRDIKIFTKIVKGGFPSMVRQGLGSISVMALNHACKPFDDAAIAAMSIVGRIINFLFSVGLGVGQGYQPVAGFNYGARKYSRVKKGFYFTWAFGTMLLGICGITALFFAGPIVHIFRDDPKVVEIGAVAMRFQCLSLIFLPFSVCNNMMFQSTGKSLQASILSSFRSGLFFLPVILIFSKLWGLTGIQMSQAVADVLASVCSIPFTVSYFKKLPKDS